MLLGWTYIAEYRYYWDENTEANGWPPKDGHTHRFDRDTLEELTIKQVERRQQQPWSDK